MLLVALLIFVAVFLSTVAAALYLHSARQASATKRRLFMMTRSRLPEVVQAEELLREVSAAEQFLYSLPFMKRLKSLVEHSGVPLSTPRVLLCTLLGTLLVFAISLAIRPSILASLLAAVITALLPLLFLSYQKKERQKKFTEQLPDALSIVARSLRAGHSLASAVELVSYELTEPSASLYKMAYDQQKLGMRMSDSLSTVQEKIESMDLSFFVTIIRINSDTGGNLAEILEKLGETIRVRMQIRRQVDVFTAEGRLSGYVLVILPVAVFYLFYLLHPEYISVFFTEKLCQMWLVGAVVAQIVGFLIIRKIINIRI